MTMDLVTAIDLRVEVLTGRVDDLEKVCAVLNAKVADLETIVSLHRPLPADYGSRKHLNRNGGAMAVNAPESRSDAPQAPEPTDRAPDTQEISR